MGEEDNEGAATAAVPPTTLSARSSTWSRVRSSWGLTTVGSSNANAKSPPRDPVKEGEAKALREALAAALVEKQDAIEDASRQKAHLDCALQELHEANARLKVLTRLEEGRQQMRDSYGPELQSLREQAAMERTKRQAIEAELALCKGRPGEACETAVSERELASYMDQALGIRVAEDRDTEGSAQELGSGCMSEAQGNEASAETSFDTATARELVLASALQAKDVEVDALQGQISILHSTLESERSLRRESNEDHIDLMVTAEQLATRNEELERQTSALKARVGRLCKQQADEKDGMHVAMALLGELEKAISAKELQQAQARATERAREAKTLQDVRNAQLLQDHTDLSDTSACPYSTVKELNDATDATALPSFTKSMLAPATEMQSLRWCRSLVP